MERVDRRKFEEWSSELCDKRHKATKEYRLKKAGNSKIKKWFYLGKDFDNYFSTPYDRVRYIAFKRWVRKAEKKGLSFMVPWLPNTLECQLYRYHNWKIHYGKFTSYWFKEVLEKAQEPFKYNGFTCLYDWDDLISGLIVKLTIKGLCFALFGNAAIHKEQMHEIWMCRKKLIKAYTYEEFFDNQCEKAVMEKYGIPFNRISYDTEVYRTTGKIVEPKNFSWSLDPRLVNPTAKTQQEFEETLNRCNEIEEFYTGLSFNEVGYFQATQHEEAMVSALSDIGKHIMGWWD